MKPNNQLVPESTIKSHSPEGDLQQSSINYNYEYILYNQNRVDIAKI
jgi:hypothetical protein